jgi:hypothetical protein
MTNLLQPDPAGLATRLEQSLATRLEQSLATRLEQPMARFAMPGRHPNDCAKLITAHRAFVEQLASSR